MKSRYGTSFDFGRKRNFSRFKPFPQIISIMLVIGIAWSMRWHVVNRLPVDYDEDDCLLAAQQYAALIRTSYWIGFLDTNYRPEHPPLEKILYGLSILSAQQEPLIPDRPTSAPPDSSLPKDLLQPARTISAVFGILEVTIMALINPLAALLLGIHAFTIKYTSQVMLESLPSLTSLVSVATYIKWKKKGANKINSWLVISGVFLGLTTSSKYLYIVAGIGVLVDWAIEAIKTHQWHKSILIMLSWGMIAIVTFLAFDPYLWTNPIGRI